MKPHVTTRAAVAIAAAAATGVAAAQPPTRMRSRSSWWPATAVACCWASEAVQGAPKEKRHGSPDNVMRFANTAIVLEQPLLVFSIIAFIVAALAAPFIVWRSTPRTSFGACVQ
jgi:hypothetical protein